MSTRLIALVLALLSSSALAQFDLANYQLVQTIPLNLSGNNEASGVTYNKDNGRLYIVEDEGLTLYELSTSGVELSSMSMSGFRDVEGITYIGQGKFLLTEERDQDVYQFTYAAGGSLTRSNLSSFSFGATVGNIGLEGISYDPVNNLVFGVKEKTPQLIYQASINFSNMTGTVTSFEPSLNVLDLSDVQALSTVPSLAGTADASNLLVISQESAQLLEVTRTGDVRSTFDFTGLSVTAEGVTIAPDGTIYMTSEDPQIFVLKQVPEPACGLLALLGGVALASRRRRVA